MKILGTILIVGGLAMAIIVMGRSVTHFDNDLDTGITLSSKETSTTSVSEIDLPTRLEIPKLKIDANVQRLGVTKIGNMAAPSNFTDVSWYKFGTIPGMIGSAVMAGHEDNALSLDGVFKHLDELTPGDDVFVMTTAGKRLHFKVVESKVYPYNLSGPELERIFKNTDKARLNLITCTGEWIQELKTNDKRLVVFTELVK